LGLSSKAGQIFFSPSFILYGVFRTSFHAICQLFFSAPSRIEKDKTKKYVPKHIHSELNTSALVIVATFFLAFLVASL